jgi:hypothetical protein
VGAHCFLDSGEKVGNAVVVVVWTSWTLRVHDHFALHERSPNKEALSIRHSHQSPPGVHHPRRIKHRFDALHQLRRHRIRIA